MIRFGIKKNLSRQQSGMSLIELMVAITIGLMFLLAMGALFLSFKNTSQAQNGISQLQDDQRMAMTILSQIIQSAGYFPNQTSTTITSALPADSTTVSGTTFAAGQAILGTTGSTSSSPDTIFVRYQTALNDGIINCLGGSNASATTTVYINQLSVASSSLKLTCSLNGTAGAGLLGGITASATSTTACSKIGYLGISNLKILYGIGASGSITQYASAAGVSNWSNVYSIQATISQLYCAQQGSLPQTINYSRVIFLPNQANS